MLTQTRKYRLGWQPNRPGSGSDSGSRSASTSHYTCVPTLAHAGLTLKRRSVDFTLTANRAWPAMPMLATSPEEAQALVNVLFLITDLLVGLLVLQRDDTKWTDQSNSKVLSA
jgi:hypothetical protein